MLHWSAMDLSIFLSYFLIVFSFSFISPYYDFLGEKVRYKEGLVC